MDLNHRPLPYQGSALTELSYRPVTNEKATCSSGGPQTGHRRAQSGQESSVADNSRPPVRLAAKLNKKAPMVDRAVISTTSMAPISSATEKTRPKLKYCVIVSAPSPNT